MENALAMGYELSAPVEAAIMEQLKQAKAVSYFNLCALSSLCTLSSLFNRSFSPQEGSYQKLLKSCIEA